MSILDAAIRAVKNVNQNRPNLPMLYDKSVFEKVVSSLRRSASSEVSRFKDMMEKGADRRERGSHEARGVLAVGNRGGRVADNY